MASSSSTFLNPLAGQTVSEKLTKTNHAIWKMQVLATVRGVRLEGFLTSVIKAPAAMIKEKQGEKEVDVPNPAHGEWVAVDQQVLGYLLSTMSKDILSQVAACKTAAETWAVVETMFSSMTKARSINTRIALATTKKGDLSITEYIGKMRSFRDEMANSGKPLDNDELVSYILTGIDSDDYNPIVTTLIARVEPVTVGEAYAQLLSFEQRMELICNTLKN
ncbi:unnamed protein product [Urochloa humidicola]